MEDKDGNPVLLNTDNEITISIEGPAALLGLESGSSVSHEDYKANKRKLFNGRLLAYVQAQKTRGVVKIKITAPGLQQKIIELK